ncbi:hypothetical protein P280DRAFT_481376 [Massarina eburnea CBS 473.64]|uniref:Uncharacterized protein n=1 Tax=Massarina eburnea CBS 473.64 TaxID=1395130 RepID=A0A6A6RUI6_9PLEO|nr:hypothetical protein P280DRAFT_481376 [Massarina eburnea CBS 473.64]
MDKARSTGETVHSSYTGKIFNPRPMRLLFPEIKFIEAQAATTEDVIYQPYIDDDTDVLVPDKALAEYYASSYKRVTGHTPPPHYRAVSSRRSARYESPALSNDLFSFFALLLSHVSSRVAPDLPLRTTPMQEDDAFDVEAQAPARAPIRQPAARTFNVLFPSGRDLDSDAGGPLKDGNFDVEAQIMGTR